MLSYASSTQANISLKRVNTFRKKLAISFSFPFVYIRVMVVCFVWSHFSLTGNELEVYFRDVFSLPLPHTDGKRRVPEDRVYHDPATLCTVGEWSGDLLWSKIDAMNF